MLAPSINNQSTTTMIPFAITIAISLITGCLGFWLGCVLNYQRGYTDAWAESDAYDAALNDLADIRWVVTPAGRNALSNDQEDAPHVACSSPLTNNH